MFSIQNVLYMLNLIISIFQEKLHLLKIKVKLRNYNQNCLLPTINIFELPTHIIMHARRD